MVDARLPDGSRVNAIIPPLALDGPSMSIRRFGTGPLAANQLVQLKSISPEMMEVLSSAVRARISILVSGGTGAGKTTFLNILSQYIPNNERLVTIEDAAELTAGAGEHCAPGNAAAEHRRPGRHQAAATAHQQPAYASRPHHHRRGARRGSLRHVAGHEHGPRGLDDNDSRQHAARRHFASRVNGGDDEHEPAGESRCGSRSPRPSRSWCRRRA
jgi:energy-coupling factor transporter ATP-binding protein EcfA2